MPEFTKFRWQSNTSNIKDEYLIHRKASTQIICWDALKDAAHKFRNVSCQFGPQYGFGARHVVRELVFDDEVHWIARVNLPETNSGASENNLSKGIGFSTWTGESAAAMQSEIDTMSFIREYTDIPVPQVFLYDTSADNAVGAPYMLMECIKGNSALDVAAHPHKIPAQYHAKYIDAEASIVVKLWTLEFDKIGSIFRNPDSGKYEIGPMANGLGGPFETAADYYRAWATKNMSVPDATSDLSRQTYELAPFISSDNHGPFRLFHPDFAVHNILVDEEYNLLSVLDWEFAFVGPSELATQQALRNGTYPLPILAVVPGVMDGNGNVIDQQWQQGFQQRSEFIGAVASQEKRLGVSTLMSIRINSLQADIINYAPGIQEGVETILKAVRGEYRTREVDTSNSNSSQKC